MIRENDFLNEVSLLVAKLMASSAKTAPKAKGIDNITTVILSKKEELEKLAKKMEELAPKYGKFYARDSKNIMNSDAVIILGCKIAKFNLKQPEIWRENIDTVVSILNLGIALGSAAKTASIHNIDNRIMLSAGVAAQELKIIDADIAIAIPLSIKGKNIFFDRKY